MSLYETLGISKDASKDDVKKAFRKLSLEHHPDKGGNEEKFKDISNAYEVLSDDDKRKNYDLGNNNPGMHQHNFNQFGRGFSFNFFNMRNQTRQEPIKKLEDTIYNIETTLEDVYFGRIKKLLVTTSSKCDCTFTCTKCNGNGRLNIVRQIGPMIQSTEISCDMCNMRGYIIKNCGTCEQGVKKLKETYDIHIASGCIEGYERRIVGKGKQAFKNTEIPGDLVFKLKILEHPSFKRRGNELIYEVIISFIDSICGCDIIIPHFDSEIKVNTSIFGVLKEGKEYIIENKGILKSNLIIIFKIDEYIGKIDQEKRDKIRELLT